MGGYGSIQPILNNNKNLLRKKNLFRDKEQRFKSSEGTLHFKECSEEELELVKKKLRKEAAKKRILDIGISVFVIVLVGFLASYLIQIDNTYEKAIQERNLKLQQEQLATYIKKGDNFYNSYHYKNALFFYKKGLELAPKNTLLQLKIKNCYRNRCENSGIDCEKIN